MKSLFDKFYKWLCFKDTLDGRKTKSLVKAEGADRLVQTQTDASTGVVSSVITREVVGDQLIQVSQLCLNNY